jgi:hypothetical protein
VHRVVWAGEWDALPRADRFEPVLLGERFEYPEGVECAGNCRWAVLDSGNPEGGAEHCQMEARVVGYEDSSAQKLEQVSCQFGEGRSVGNVGVPNPADRGRLFGDGAGRTDKRSEPQGLVAIWVEQHECKRDDLVALRIGAGHFAVEDRVARGGGNLAPAAKLAWCGHWSCAASVDARSGTDRRSAPMPSSHRAVRPALSVRVAGRGVRLAR